MKIKCSLLLKWCECNLTNKEFTFLLLIARYQDKDGYGHVKGIYYKDIMEKCNMCQMTFYMVLRSLKQKGLIDYTRKNKDYDITILNNDFSYEGALKEGYINLNKSIFDEEKFKKLRVNEKILLMLFMSVTYKNKGSYRIGIKTFYEKYTKLLGVTQKVLRSYLHSLKEFFNIWVKGGNYYIRFLAREFKEKKEKEIDQYLDHIINTECRRNKVDTNQNDDNFKDTITVIKQYWTEAKEAGQDILVIFANCMAECTGKILNSKYIHKLIRRTLGIEKRPALSDMLF